MGMQAQYHEVGADLDVETFDHAAPPTVEAVGQAQQRREFPQALASALVERRGTCF